VRHLRVAVQQRYDPAADHHILVGSEHISLYRKPNPWTLAVLSGPGHGGDVDGPAWATLRVDLP